MYKRAFQRIVRISVLLAEVIALTGCGRGKGGARQNGAPDSAAAGYHQECPTAKLLDCLAEGGAGLPYAYARILIAVDDNGQDSTEGVQSVDIMGGTAYISWQTFGTAEEFQTYYFAPEQEGSQLPQGYAVELAYYQYQLEEGDYAVDIYQYLNERYGSREGAISAFSINAHKTYRLSQPYPSAVREMVVRERVLYGLERRDAAEGVSQEDVIKELLSKFGQQKLRGNDDAGWVQRGTFLDEEDLYWLDHDERVSTLQDPVRSFTEVGAVEMVTGLRWICFAMLKEADYQVELHEGGPVLGIHFEFQKDIPADGFETPLYNRLCMSEPYNMRVTDLDTGELLQEMVVEMSIEVPDMVTFEDLDSDGYLDMKIDMPTHWNERRAVVDEFSWQVFLLWEPEEKLFAFRDKDEIRLRRMRNEQTDAPVIYIVQPGDTLWEISKRFYGKGARYTEIQAANAEVLACHEYLIPGMVLEIPDV